MIIATDKYGKSRVIIDIKCGPTTKGLARVQFADGDSNFQPIPFDAISWVPDNTVLNELR
jgi:hypothetical protein